MVTIEEIQINLREAIKNSALTQKEIAEKLQVHPTAVNKYMHDDVYPSLETFAKLCEILDVSSDDILGLKQ
ncbi:MAG: helix-turn-helix domain-containing protein [Clostridia bacterium]|nr:helix-turn-helix domain-containing protein [Clostridia bacterium]